MAIRSGVNFKVIIALVVAALLMLGLVATGVTSGSQASASSNVHYVDADADADAPGTGCDDDAGYTTIGAALSAAAAGDTVIVCPGTYAESPTLTRSALTLTTDAPVENRGLDLDGDDQTVISGTVQIRDNANNATVEGFKITGSGTGVNIHSGISNTMLRYLTVDGNAANGINLRGNATLENSTVSNNGSDGLANVGSNALIQDNEIVENSGRGIDSRASHVDIKGNTISGSGSFGVFLGSGSTDHIIDGNTIANNGSHGVHVSTSGHTVSNNQVHGNDNRGIHVSSSDNTISHNIVSGNEDGIAIDAGNNNTVSGGASSGNNRGVFVRGTNNTVDGVEICGNTTQDLQIHGASNDTDILNNKFDTVLDSGTNTSFSGNAPCGPLWVAEDGSAGPDDCAGTDAAFETIQDAVDWFVGTPFVGGTINVCEGTYVENVQVRDDAGHPNNLTIKAVEEATVELGPDSSHVFFIRSRTGVVIEGLTIAGSTSPAAHAVRLMGGSDNTITDNTFASGGVGSTHGSSANEVTHNVFENPGRTAISSGTGWIVSHNVVLQSSFHPTNPAAISIGGSGASVSHNEVSNAGSTGIRLGGGGDHTLNHNTVEDGRTGIDVASDNNQIVHALVEDNTHDGIRLDGDENTVNQSRACGNGDNADTFDILVVSGDGNTIRNSRFDTGEDHDNGTNTTWHQTNRGC